MSETVTTQKYELTLDNIQYIVQELAEALGDYQSCARRLGASPLYGRDASNVGVRSGTSFATDSDDWNNAYERARAAIDDALDAGILKEKPYGFY